MIRSGDLDAGGREIEIAVALDPNNSLLRSYLGKAYFEEKRDPLDAEQYAIAKELDPNDPTPWFYDAIRLQTENRPVEALRNLERSIELNDNRAVYRSRLLLDEDCATRGTSLARIYDDLGFEQLGLRRGDEVAEPRSGQLLGASLPLRHLCSACPGTRSPGPASCCRRSCCSRSTSTRSSRACRSPISTSSPAPVRPEAAFNEFTPLFERNRRTAHRHGLRRQQRYLGR